MFMFKLATINNVDNNRTMVGLWTVTGEGKMFRRSYNIITVDKSTRK